MENIQIVLNVLILIAILFIIFFRSYSFEKGKNLATKEDVSEITHKIESVKNQIYFNTQNKLSIKVAERDAFIKLHEKYHLWFSTIFEISFSPSDNAEAYQSIHNRLNDSRVNFIIARAHAELFISNKELMSIVNELYAELYKLHHKLYCLPYKLQVLKTHEKLDLHKNILFINRAEKIRIEYLDKYQEIILEWYEYRNQTYKDLETLERNFNKVLQPLIKNIYEESD